MNQKSLIPLTLFFLIVESKTFSQNIAINSTGSTPDTSAMLDISSTTKGLLIPRMTTTQLGNIPTPARGLLAFSTTDSSFKVNLSSTSTPLWTEMLSCATGWAIAGNNCANSSTSLGTTNNRSIRFITNNIERMVLDSNGRIGFNITTPTATLHLPAGTSAANGAPLKFTSGVASQTTKEVGALNYDGSDLTLSDATYAYTLTKTISGSATLDFPAALGSSVSDLTITVTGAAVGDVVLLGVPQSSTTATSCYSAWVSSANTVTVRFSNGSLLTPENPASGTFKVRVIK